MTHFFGPMLRVVSRVENRVGQLLHILAGMVERFPLLMDCRALQFSMRAHALHPWHLLRGGGWPRSTEMTHSTVGASGRSPLHGLGCRVPLFSMASCVHSMGRKFWEWNFSRSRARPDLALMFVSFNLSNRTPHDFCRDGFLLTPKSFH
jgi:hypothetical protein